MRSKCTICSSLSLRWVPGNLPFDSLCTVCEEPAGDGPGIKDLRCVWCQRTLHTDCQKAAQVAYSDTGAYSFQFIKFISGSRFLNESGFEDATKFDLFILQLCNIFLPRPLLKKKP
jgi:hypothetical protein